MNLHLNQAFRSWKWVTIGARLHAASVLAAPLAKWRAVTRENAFGALMRWKAAANLISIHRLQVERAVHRWRFRLLSRSFLAWCSHRAQYLRRRKRLASVMRRWRNLHLRNALHQWRAFANMTFLRSRCLSLYIQSWRNAIARSGFNRLARHAKRAAAQRDKLRVAFGRIRNAHRESARFALQRWKRVTVTCFMLERTLVRWGRRLQATSFSRWRKVYMSTKINELASAKKTLMARIRCWSGKDRLLQQRSYTYSLKHLVFTVWRYTLLESKFSNIEESNKRIACKRMLTRRRVILIKTAWARIKQHSLEGAFLAILKDRQQVFLAHAESRRRRRVLLSCFHGWRLETSKLHLYNLLAKVTLDIDDRIDAFRMMRAFYRLKVGALKARLEEDHLIRATAVGDIQQIRLRARQQLLQLSISRQSTFRRSYSPTRANRNARFANLLEGNATFASLRPLSSSSSSTHQSLDSRHGKLKSAEL